MKQLSYTLLILMMLFAMSCTEKNHLISDKAQRVEVQRDWQLKKAAIPNGDFFTVFDENLTQKEREALEFLYAYMPLCDVTDYSGKYFLRNVDASLLAKEEMPWGEVVPEREFNHFVLPIRVNNENLDDSRFVFYDELKDRVKNFSMYDAVLEVNHWCHEKVSYRGSDSRTSAPLATVKTSWGRCGEESTFLVAALRSVCIPARQVYTPRWAHCDDNHAWVEAWVEGKWYFLGACEPEPVLDLGWFNAPSSRCLLLHTRVFGKYFGPEEVIERTANHTEINVVDKYAETAKLNIKVVDNHGNAVKDAKVDFKIYNYAEYCTVATKRTGEDGTTWMTAGLGTMMIYASKDGKFGYKVLKIGSVENVEIVLSDFDKHGEEIYDVNPPAEQARFPEVTAEMRVRNDSRITFEDAMRNAYIARCEKAQNEGDYDKEIMSKTWGNYQTIKDFIDYARCFGKEKEAYDLLKVISDKDLRDVTIDVLIDCIDNQGVKKYSDEIYNKYVYNPRISNEMLSPYKRELATMKDFADSPQDLIAWVKDNILINNDLNVRGIPMKPTSVMRARLADSHSRDIFFVACARTAGIPARIDHVTGKVQYLENNWIDVGFEAINDIQNKEKGTLVIDYEANSMVNDPRYYTHFSIKKFNGNTFDLLAYDAKDPGMDVGMLYSELMANGGMEMDEGNYVMSSGTRLENGSVLNQLVFFTIESGEKTEIKLVMREPSNEKQVIGKLNLEKSLLPRGYEKDYYVIAFLDGGSEPTTHAMQDISILKEKFDNWGGEMIFIFQDKENFEKFKSKKFNELPSKISFKMDADKIFDSVITDMKLSNLGLPIFLITNANNEVIFVSQGYRIGLGEQILQKLL